MHVHSICNFNSFVNLQLSFIICLSQIHVDSDKFKPGKYQVDLEMTTLSLSLNTTITVLTGQFKELNSKVKIIV